MAQKGKKQGQRASYAQQVACYDRAGAFLAQVYRILAVHIPGEEWQKIGKQCGWTPEQIGLAEKIAVKVRQELYTLAQAFE